LHPTSTTPTSKSILTILQIFGLERGLIETRPEIYSERSPHLNWLRFTKFRSETSNVGPRARIADSKQIPQTLTAGTNIVRAPLETPSACNITRQISKFEFDRPFRLSVLLHKVLVSLVCQRCAGLPTGSRPEYIVIASVGINQHILIHNGGFWIDEYWGGIWVSWSLAISRDEC
jgi:hypothetical protein